MGLREVLNAKREEILTIAARHGARNVRIFGSVARGEDNDQSDVDFLVEMEKGRSLLDRAGFLVEVEALLGRKVDVATDRTLKPAIRDRVMKDVVPI